MEPIVLGALLSQIYKSDPRNIWKLVKEFGINGRITDNENTFGIKCESGMITN